MVRREFFLFPKLINIMGSTLTYPAQLEPKPAIPPDPETRATRKKQLKKTAQFAAQLKKDRHNHLSQKIDPSLIEKECSTRWKHFMRAQTNSLDGEELGWVGLIDKWLKKEAILFSAQFFQQEMLFVDFNLRGRF